MTPSRSSHGPKAHPYERAVELTKEAMQLSDDADYDGAEELLREAMDLVPDEELFTQNYVQFCLQVAHNHTLEDNHGTAIDFYRKALEQFPDDAEGWMDLGAAYARNNEPLEALQAWQAAVALMNPKKGRDKQNIQDILENVREVERALGKGT